MQITCSAKADTADNLRTGDFNQVKPGKIPVQSAALELALRFGPMNPTFSLDKVHFSSLYSLVTFDPEWHRRGCINTPHEA